MHPHVRLRLPDAREVALGPGELIGRLWSAALHIDDARISEAHAMVSLRGGELKLLALRGRFAIDGKPLTDLVLKRGQVLQLARGYALEVVDVVLPDHVLAIEGDGLPRQHLIGVCSLFATAPPRLAPRWLDGADAWIWSTGERWRLRTPDGEALPLDDGTTWSLRSRAFRAVAVPLEAAGPQRTRALGAVQTPLRIVSYFDTVHLHRDGQPTLQLRGQGARIVSELVACGAPVGWASLARELWPAADADTHALRRRWDVALARLRSRLKSAGVRPDLVRADGSGLFELFLYEGDSVEDKG